MYVNELKKKLEKRGLPCTCEQETKIQAGSEPEKRYIVFSCKYGLDNNEIWCRMDGLHIKGIKCEGPQEKSLADFCKNELQKECWMRELDMYPCPVCGKNTLEPQRSVESPEFYVECTNCGNFFPSSQSLTISGVFVVDSGKYASTPVCKIK